MGIVSRLVAGVLGAESGGGVPGPSSDFWYQPVGSPTSSGMRVDAESAQRVSAFHSGLRLLSNDVAKLPFEIFERQEDGGKVRARTHPVYDVLHTQPNVWQTSFEWRRQGVRHLILRGNWYNRIVAGPRGPIDQLVPIAPDLVKPQQLETGRIVYHIRNRITNVVTIFTQDEIFHVRGVSDDGVEGKSLLTWARDSIGIALATESYASRLFSQGSLHGGVISVPAVLDAEASKRMAASFTTSASTWHLPKVLEQGATFSETTLTPEDSQFLTSRQFSVTEMARWLGIPPHKVGDLSRSTNNNIEEQGIDYVGDGLSPWLVLIESSADRDLIVEADRFFAEINADGLMRGNSQARGEFYSKMFNVGAYSPNDIRKKENENAVEGGDTYFVPANMRPSTEPFVAPGAPGAADPGTPPAKTPPPAPSGSSARADTIVNAAAERVLRKEIATVRAAGVRFASNAALFDAEVGRFYQKHEAYVVATLQLTDVGATAYCDHQAQQIKHTSWPVTLERWSKIEYVAGVALLALGVETD